MNPTHYCYRAWGFWNILSSLDLRPHQCLDEPIYEKFLTSIFLPLLATDGLVLVLWFIFVLELADARSHPFLHTVSLNFEKCDPHILKPPSLHHHYRHHQKLISLPKSIARPWDNRLAILIKKPQTKLYLLCLQVGLIFKQDHIFLTTTRNLCYINNHLKTNKKPVWGATQSMI